MQYYPTAVRANRIQVQPSGSQLCRPSGEGIKRSANVTTDNMSHSFLTPYIPGRLE